MERGKIEKAIKRLMHGDEGTEIRQRMKAMKHEASCCIRSDGSSSINIDKLINSISSFLTSKYIYACLGPFFVVLPLFY
jgi:NADPH-dependent glutamate synthase beta subunit-like oxidoreductase